MVSEKFKNLVCEAFCTCNNTTYDKVINDEDLDYYIENFYLSDFVTNEEFTRNNLLEAFIKLADEGDIEAEKEVGKYYAYKEYVDFETFQIDKQNAIKYYKMAADQGDLEASYELGFIAEDTSEKIKYLTFASNKGLASAHSLLGDIYYEGNTTIYDIEPNYELAVKYYKMTIDSGRAKPDAYARLARCYLEGLGVEKNDITALMLLNNAEGKSNEGTFIRAILAYEGKVVEQDVDYAFKNFKFLACQESFRPAYFYLAECYNKGIGTDIDNKKAMKYYKAGAHQGDEKCKEFLNNLI